LGEETPHLFDCFDRIHLVNAKTFDSEHTITTSLVGKSPDISESSNRECSLAGRLDEFERNLVTSGKDPI